MASRAGMTEPFTKIRVRLGTSVNLTLYVFADLVC